MKEISIPLGNDYADIRDAVSKICADFPGEYWRKLDADSAYPEEFVNALTESGFLSALIPEEYGGVGLPLRAAAVIMETIHASGGSASACHAQMYIMGAVLSHGSEEQKQKYLPKIATGELRLQAFGVTEPTSGSDTTKLRTKAVKKGDKYIVNGQKVWTSRAFQSDLMLLLARTTPLEEVSKPTDGMSIFLVDMRDVVGNGMEIRAIDAMINHNTTEVFFDNMEIPADSLIGEEGKGFRYVMSGMNAERVIIAGESIGDARFFIERAKNYASERKIFSGPIGKNQGVQFPIARAYAEIEAAELMARKAAALFEAGEPCGAEANMAKMLCAEAAWNAGEACMQTHGGFAFAKEYDIERKWREARLYLIAPISTNMILSYIGQHVLGMPKSY
ncbi:acyl-CoA dehydrogenase family protein [Cycloclasticus sp. P1]|uniref:acyl-CoA dehydrogenase family protein n=1 Tax=Cycloclasticus sp. (strain P1) TaxID=385025 RepID=UPI000286A9E4|nr:acyl-CoA dehydrogenase family protein [Cycloclasticus sp. P1]AFT67285.1 Acyl-CoA dehydrogenase domain protein [Cycloclasticus sp. P1]